MRSRSMPVEILNSECVVASGPCSGHVEVRRESAGVLAVIVDMRRSAQPNVPCWGWRRVEYGGISSPEALRETLLDAASQVSAPIDWSIALPLVAEVDWLLASLLAKRVGDPAIPVIRLPSFEALKAQRPVRALRALGSVTVEVEWGYDMHEASFPFDKWLRALCGSPVIVRNPYYYEGERFIGEWEAEGTKLRVGYGDGGVGWDGDLNDVDALAGPKIDDVDIAALTLMAADRSHPA